MTADKETAKSDKTGIASAMLCTVHCLAIPALFLIKYMVAGNSGVVHLPTWWERLDYLFLLISFWAVYHSAGHTRSGKIKIALWTSWVLLAIAILHASSLHWLAYVASAGLITTHYINLRLAER